MVYIIFKNFLIYILINLFFYTKGSLHFYWIILCDTLQVPNLRGFQKHTFLSHSLDIWGALLHLALLLVVGELIKFFSGSRPKEQLLTELLLWFREKQENWKKFMMP